ncbi:MAG: NodT family efflux transporter outer membrane factor (OMF) lipoprotein [Halioglobus sp.]
MIEPIGKYLGIGALAMGLTACTALGPDYQQPDVQWLQQWEADLHGQVVPPSSGEGSNPDLRFWWHLFDDPTLNKLVDLARSNNPSLRIAGLRILESRATAGIARGNRYPQVQQANGAISYINSNQSRGPDDTFRDYQGGLRIGWELDFWGRFERSIESADAAFSASVFDQQNVQVLLTSQVADLYYAYRTTQLSIKIAQSNAAIQKRSFEITEQLFTSGQNSELDLQRAKTQYLSTVANIPSLEITLTQLRNALGVLLGRPPGHLPELDEQTALLLPTLDAIELKVLPAQLLMRRPDIRSAAATVAIASAQVGFTEAGLYPAVSLLGNISWSDNSISGSPESVLLGIGPSFTWNLFNYGRIKNNVRVQDARLQQAIESFQDTVLKGAREIDDAAVGMVKTREQRIPQHDSTVAAYRSLELANTRYREGYESFQSVLDAQRTVATTSQSELINDSNHISAVISFYAAIGGGWVTTPTLELIPEETRKIMELRSNWDDLLSAPLEPVMLDNIPAGAKDPANE